MWRVLLHLSAMNLPCAVSPRSRAHWFVVAISAVAACGGSSGGPAENPIPTITGTTPAQLVASSAATPLSVTGRGFNASTRARWNGQDRVTTVTGPGALIVQITATDLSISAVGSGQLTLANPAPGGGSSDPFPIGIAYPVPVITSLSQTSATLGVSGVDLLITGTGFSPASKVSWNSSQLFTEFGGPTLLRVVVLSTFFPTAGTYTITVTNPSPGGGTSAPVTFTVQGL